MNAISPIPSSIYLRSRGATKKGLITSTGECGTDSSAAARKRSVGGKTHRPTDPAGGDGGGTTSTPAHGCCIGLRRAWLTTLREITEALIGRKLSSGAVRRMCLPRLGRSLVAERKEPKFADSLLEGDGFEPSVPGR